MTDSDRAKEPFWLETGPPGCYFPVSSIKAADEFLVAHGMTRKDANLWTRDGHQMEFHDVPG